MPANERITRDDQVVCITQFSKVLPIEDGEVKKSISGIFFLKIFREINFVQNFLLKKNVLKYFDFSIFHFSLRFTFH